MSENDILKIEFFKVNVGNVYGNVKAYGNVLSCINIYIYMYMK